MDIKKFIESVVWENVGRWVLVVLALVLLTASFLVIRSCTGDSTAQYWRGQYDSLKEVTDIEKDILLSDIDKLNDTIDLAQKEIEMLIVARVDQERQVMLLSAQREKLIIEEPIQPELESEPLIINLREQIKKMSLVIYEQEKIIQTNDKIIFNLTTKYQAQLKISNNYKSLYDGEKELHSLALKRLSVTEKQVKWLKFGGTLKNGVILGVVAYSIYSIVK